jgi:cytochrome P450
MMLAMHKNVQQKAYEEVEMFFENSRENIALRDINNLQYIELLLKETMRLFPPAATPSRYSTGNVQLGEI